MIIHYMITMRCLYQTHWLLRGWSQWPVQTPSVSISGFKSVKSGASTFIFWHSPHQFHGWNRTESLVWSRHEVNSLVQYLTHEPQHLPLGSMPKATLIIYIYICKVYMPYVVTLPIFEWHKTRLVIKNGH